MKRVLLSLVILFNAPSAALAVFNPYPSYPSSITTEQGTSPWVENITEFGGSAFSLGAQTQAKSLSITPATGASFPVTGTFYQTTQPVSIATTVPVSIATTLPVSLDGTAGTGISQPTGGAGSLGWFSGIYNELVSILAKLTSGILVTGTFYQAIQPVSGTVSAIVNTPAPGPTNASGIPLVAPTNIPNPLPVTTPAPGPTPPYAVTQGTTPWAVNTPAPGPTSASGYPETTSCDPTTAGRCKIVSSTGVGDNQVCNATPTCVTVATTISNGFSPTDELEGLTFNMAYNGNTSSWDYFQVDNSASSALHVSVGGSNRNILTSASATTCTSLSGNAGRLVMILDTGATMSVYPEFYDEGASPGCNAADLIYGDGSTITPTGGIPLILNIPTSSGIAYKLSGALTSNLIVTRN